MNKPHIRFRRKHRASLWPFWLVVLLSIGQACSAIQPTETGGPRANLPVYPVLLTEDPQRREATLIAVRQALAPGTENLNVELHPATATIKSLPSNLPFYLPRVGIDPVMSEEETRESLRRFINDWRNIIGVDPSHLSLVEQGNMENGTRVARYDQRPFRYPLRGGFGTLEIHFATDRRLLSINSTCIPDAERFQNVLATITPVVTAEDAEKYVVDNGISYSDGTGGLQSSRPLAGAVDARELVYYVMASSSQPDSLEFHLAWAIHLTDSPVKIAYLDAVNSRIIAAE